MLSGEACFDFDLLFFGQGEGEVSLYVTGLFSRTATILSSLEFPRYRYNNTEFSLIIGGVSPGCSVDGLIVSADLLCVSADVRDTYAQDSGTQSPA